LSFCDDAIPGRIAFFMGKTKNPNEVEQESFSDSLELFDSLFQEELESGTNKQVPPKRTTAQPRPPSTKIPDIEDEKVSDFLDEQQPYGLEAIPQAKKSPAPTKAPDRGVKGAGPKMKRPVPEQKKVPDKKAATVGKRDTLKVKKKGADPTSEPEQPDDEAIQESGFGPIGMIRLPNEGDEEPLPASASPEKVGKLYTPKESKNLLPNISIKESNLYKIALSGFAVAIIVMVLINFFGLIGSKEPREPSIQKNKSAVQKASPKKRSNEVAKKVKASSATKTSKRNAAVQKRSPKPASAPRRNQITKKPSVKKAPSRKTAVVPSSPPQPKTVLPETVEKKQEVQASFSAPQPSPPKSQETNETARVASIVKAPSYPYSVYLGAFKTLERARVAVSQYQKKGVSSYWVKVDLGRKGTWHRLFTGHFRDGGTALDYINKRDLNEASVKNTKYTTLVGLYSSEDALIEKSQALDKLGYSTYVVDGSNGTSQLYSGAFITKGGAEKHYQELVSKGIRSRVIER
jgi:hypothetical protein